MWTGEHQEAFDVLKSYFTSAPVLGTPDLSQPFRLEIDVSLQGLDVVLSQWSEYGTQHIKAHANQSLWPNEQLMQNYISAKLELLVINGW